MKVTGAVLAEIDTSHKSGYRIIKIGNIKPNIDRSKSRANLSKSGDPYKSEMYMFRCRDLFIGLKEFAEGYDSLDAIVAELPSGGGRNAIALAQMMCALGACSAFSAACGVPVIPVQPGDTKSVIGGVKNASKLSIEMKVRAIFNNYAWPPLPALTDKSTATQYEHIMDAAAALLVARDTSVYQLLSREAI